MNYIRDKLDARFGKSVLPHIVQCNRHTWEHPFRTHDGIDVGGERIAEEILEVVKNNPSLKRISFVGHSLGGMYARYVSARLFDEGTRKLCGTLELMNFVTLSSPHLGVRSTLNPVFEWWARNVTDRTGKQLLLEDGAIGEMPLLVRMVTNDGLPFLDSLQAFKGRWLYAITRYDTFVSYQTGAISAFDFDFSAQESISSEEPYPHVVSIYRGPLSESPRSPSPLPPAAKRRLTALNNPQRIGMGFPILDMVAARLIPKDRQEEFFESESEEYRYHIKQMIESLGLLEWTRVDVDFKHFMTPVHTNVAVARRWRDFLGEDVVEHMIDQLYQSSPAVVSV